MKAKEAADRIVAHVYGHVDAFSARPPGPAPAKQFAAAGLMRCCALLKGILVLDEARMPGLAGILARQHLETWIVSLYVLFDGYEALQVVASDDIFWRSRLFKKLRLEGDDHHPDSAKRPEKPKKLNYKVLTDHVLELLHEREPGDGPVGVTVYDVIYSYESLVSAHANLTTIGGHLVDGDDGCWAVSVDSSLTQDDDVAVTPVLLTGHLAQYVFKEFGLDGDAMARFVADLVVPARAQEHEGN